MTIQLLPRTTCPHCWNQFAPEDVWWVSAHEDLRGADERLGEVHRRFLPSRFTVRGEAIDAKGMPCTDLACPECHLSIPRAVLELEQYSVSVLGTPASGKSFFLAAMTWELNRLLPDQFAVNLSNADPAANYALTKYEENLFMNRQGDTLIPLRTLVLKTDQNDRNHFDFVRHGEQVVKYPRPFLFGMKPAPRHTNIEEAERISRLLCLYDISGEQCLPGGDSSSDAATRHVATSNLLLFIFDPLQDTRFRRAMGLSENETARDGQLHRQETVLHEAAARIRRYTGLAQNAKHNRPLVVVVTKFDAWGNIALLKNELKPEPWAMSTHLGGQQAALDTARIRATSEALRDLLYKHCPEFVNVAEDLAEPLFVPVSALGRQPEREPVNGELAIMPKHIKPRWVTVPLLAGDRAGLAGLIFHMKRR